MEILFMAFMIIVSVMSLFAVAVVIRDVVRETVNARKEKKDVDKSVLLEIERLIALTQANKSEAAVQTTPISEICVKIDEPMTPLRQELPAVSKAETLEKADVSLDTQDGTISFATGAKQTLSEKYLELSKEARGWYDEIVKYAAAVEGSKCVKNDRYEEYKVGNSRIIRMLIKRGVIMCEFFLHNTDFKSYVYENKINVRQSSTTMLIESAASVEVAKNTINIVVAAIAEEKEYKKQLAKEKRRAARAAQNK